MVHGAFVLVRRHKLVLWCQAPSDLFCFHLAVKNYEIGQQIMARPHTYGKTTCRRLLRQSSGLSPVAPTWVSGLCSCLMAFSLPGGTSIFSPTKSIKDNKVRSCHTVQLPEARILLLHHQTTRRCSRSSSSSSWTTAEPKPAPHK